MLDYRKTVLELVRGEGFLRATFGGMKRLKKDIKWERVVLRAVQLREGVRLQVTRFDGRKDLTSNHDFTEADEALADVLEAGFANVHVTTEAEEVNLRLTKKGELQAGRKRREPGTSAVRPTIG